MATSLSSLPNTVMPTFCTANLLPTAEMTPTVLALPIALEASTEGSPKPPAQPPTSSSKAKTTLGYITPSNAPLRTLSVMAPWASQCGWMLDCLLSAQCEVRRSRARSLECGVRKA